MYIGKKKHLKQFDICSVLKDFFPPLQNAIATKRRKGRDDVREHFLDYSTEEYGIQLVNETKSLFNILLLFSPLPIFWTLYMQQGSRWVNQAKTMDLNIGSLKIDPSHMQTLNPIFILAFIPLFDYCVYPLLSKIGLRRPLQKLTVGAILAAFAFLLAAIVQYEIEKHQQNTVSVLWQVPQNMALSAGFVMFSVVGFSFSFEQAPKRMKTVVQGCFSLTITIGNLLLAIISSFQMFEFDSYRFIFYEILMLASILIFVVLANRYKPIVVD